MATATAPVQTAPPTASSPSATPVITASGLQANVAPLTVPQSPNPTATPELHGAIQGTQQTWQQQLDSAASTAKTGMASSLSELLKAELGGGQAQYQNDAYTQYGVDKAHKDLTDVNTQLTAEQNALNHKVDAIRKNTDGLFGTGVQQLVDKASSESLSRQADLSVIQLAKTGAYDSAKAMADRAVAAKMEFRQNQIAVLGQIYTANKDIFSTAEQHQFEAAQATRNNQLQIDAHKETAKYDEMIKQSDPLYRAQLSGQYLANQKAAHELQTSGGVDASNLGGTPTANNGAALTSIIRSSKIGAGTKTQLANILGVVNASSDLAKNNATGSFGGVYPGAGAVNFVKGLFGKKDTASINNEGSIDAINLKVQQWASGASLTAQQTAQVNKFVPNVNDSDSQARDKLNNLSNFMLTQAQSQLQSEGVNFTPQRVDLFGDSGVKATTDASGNITSGTVNGMKFTVIK